MYVAATQYILGVKPTPEGLKINPCIPSSWDGFNVRRKFRNCIYNIKVARGTGEKIIVDGRETDGDVIYPKIVGYVMLR